MPTEKRVTTARCVKTKGKLLCKKTGRNRQPWRFRKADSSRGRWNRDGTVQSSLRRPTGQGSNEMTSQSGIKSSECLVIGSSQKLVGYSNQFCCFWINAH